MTTVVEHKPVTVICYRNVADLVRGVNRIEVYGDEKLARVAATVWRRIRNLFHVYATMMRLPENVEFHEIGCFGDKVKLLASSEYIVPNKPPKYIAFVSPEETLVIDSSVRAYRRIYVKILRLLAKATFVKTTLDYSSILK